MNSDRSGADDAVCTADVAVVGTGVMGMAVAIELADQGHSVALIGPGWQEGQTMVGSASGAAGAMLTVLSEVEAEQGTARTNIEVRERVAAREDYDKWLDVMADRGGDRVTLRPGTWVLGNAARPADLANLDAMCAAAAEYSLPVERHPVEVVPGFFPDRGRQPTQALYLPRDAGVDGAELLTALESAAEVTPRLRLVRSAATGIARKRTGLTVSCWGSRVVHADQVVLAAGTGLGELLANSDLEHGLPPLLAKRGVGLVVESSLRPDCPVRTPGRGLAGSGHVVPRQGNKLYLGSTSTLLLPTGGKSGATLGEINQLIQDCGAEINAELRQSSFVEAYVGNRPVTWDGLPLLGRTADPNVLVATATNRCGVLLAPHFGRLLAEEIANRGKLAQHPYRPDRPQHLPEPDELAASGAQALVDTLFLPHGSGLSRQEEYVLRGLVTTALRDVLAGRSGDDRDRELLDRLWARAPIAEALPTISLAISRSCARRSSSTAA